MQFTQSNLDFIFYGFDARFQSTYMAAPTYYQQFAATIASTGREIRYGWLDRIPQARLWLGERQIVNISTRSYTLVNQDYELTLEVDRNSIQDDQVGIYAPLVDMLAYEAKLWQDQLMVPVLQTGDQVLASSTCHDGQPFFSASHPKDIDNSGSSTQSNFFTGTALTATNFASVRATMMAYQGSDNRPFGIMPSLLIVPPALEVTARQILFGTIIAPTGGLGINAAQAQTNVMTGMAQLLVYPYLAGQDTTWYLLDNTKPIKPFIFQLRQAPIFVYKNNIADPNLFWRRKFVYGWDARGAAGIALWFLAAKAVA